jgi:hypothetical protein
MTVQLNSLSRRQSNPPPDAPIPYPADAMRQDLQRVRNVWDECQSNRDRDAIYSYLNAVYDLVSWWRVEGRELDRARQALRLERLDAFDHEDPFAAVIRCTADPAKADKRTRSKWSHVMRYAVEHKELPEPLGTFVKRKGGINKCAGRFSRLKRRAENGIGTPRQDDDGHRQIWPTDRMRSVRSN